MTARLDALRHWAFEHHQSMAGAPRLEVVTDDASFRRYFRLYPNDGPTRILMDAPPSQEDSRPFVDIARRWQRHGIRVPTLYRVDLAAGFIELQDLGDEVLRSRLADPERGDALMHEAISTAVDIAALPADDLPIYDVQRLADELDLFPAWCLERWLGLDLFPDWHRVRDRLVRALAAQPQVCVHRDYHPQNLMLHDERLWVIDFQGAVRGPLAYDLASLLRDRNPPWPEAQQRRWIEAFRLMAIERGVVAEEITADDFRRMVDLTGAQRSLKVLGLFCRLALRDLKPRYLALLPLFVEHVRQGLIDQPGFEDFMQWFDTDFAPALHRRLRKQPDEASHPTPGSAPA